MHRIPETPVQPDLARTKQQLRQQSPAVSDQEPATSASPARAATPSAGTAAAATSTPSWQPLSAPPVAAHSKPPASRPPLSNGGLWGPSITREPSKRSLMPLPTLPSSKFVWRQANCLQQLSALSVAVQLCACVLDGAWRCPWRLPSLT